MSARIVWDLAVADFRDRYRRMSYSVTLLAAVGLGCVAAPAADSRWVVMYVGEHRGIYNSAYTGTLIALASALWLTLGGFYVVRTAIAKDERTHVGELLAATPVRSATYLAAKFLSNFMVLASMVGVLTVTAAVLQLARGESRTIQPIELLLPFALLALPVAALTAAAALIFDAVPALRSGVGNIIWFACWLVIAIAGQAPGTPFGGIGVSAVAQSLRDAMVAQHIRFSQGSFSLGLTYLDNPLRTFRWGGLDPDLGLVAGRAALVALSVGLALLPALWFHRFDPARGRFGSTRTAAVEQGLPPSGAVLTPPVTPLLPSGAPAPSPRIALPTVPPRRGLAFGRLLMGEVRILVQGVSPWWWAGLLLVASAGVVLPIRGVSLIMLPLCWLWPILVWSRLGAQRYEADVDVLLSAYPHTRRRLLAEWTAGLLLTAVAGLVPAARLAFAGDSGGLAAWAGGALFIPSLALLFGELGQTQRLFQAVYLSLWYAAVNGIAVVDYMGASRPPDQPASVITAATPALAVLLLGSAVVIGSTRRRVRT